MKGMKISKGKSRYVNRTRTDNIMAKTKRIHIIKFTMQY